MTPQTDLLPPLPEAPRPLYSVVAWPPQALDTWMRRAQASMNVSGFGLPHLNLRAPFQTSLGSADLIAALRDRLRGERALDVRVKGWKRLSGVIFLEFELSAALIELHLRLLEVGPSSRAPYDGADYRPHLTLALGILPWAEEQLWQAALALTPPLEHFTIEALSLTREQRGEVQELHTFPLLTSPEEVAAVPQAGAAPS